MCYQGCFCRGNHLTEAHLPLPCVPLEETLSPGGFFPPPCLCCLCRSFVQAFLEVNQGENCSRSCLEATRGWSWSAARWSTWVGDLSPYEWAGCFQEKSFLLHLIAFGHSILPCFGFLASGNW